MRQKPFFFSFVILMLTACTQSVAPTTPVPPPATVTPTLSLASPVPQINTPDIGAETPLPAMATFTPIGQPTPGKSDTYAVIQVPDGELLNIRSGPGVENPVVGTLQPSGSGVKRTGKMSGLGEDIWVEIQNPGGGTGWVKSEFLTEYVEPSVFCGDAHVTELLRNFETAITTTDGELLKSLVSPSHGLDITYIRDGISANYSPEEAGWVFQSTYVVDWGLGAGSGEPVSGTFPEIVLPALQDVFKNLITACNVVKLGGATYGATWPTEYANLNFYSLHNSGNDPSLGGLDWRTWLAGIDYVDGQPYLMALSHYQWEP